MFLFRGLCPGGLCPGESVSKDVSLSRGRALCPLGFLSRGKGSLSSTVSLQGVSVQRSLSKGLCSRMCLCPGGEVIVQGSLCPGESLPRGSLPRGVSVRDIPQTVKLGEVVVGSLFGIFGSKASM